MTTLLVTAASYLLGCWVTAYYWFRLATGGDIREHGSGNAGARNIGRELGQVAFCVTFLCDLLKGMAAVGLARRLGLGEEGMTLAALAVVAGHIWPVQLGFRGGKGVAAGMGALAAFDPALPISSLCAFGIAAWASKHCTLSGLAAIFFLPLIALGLGRSGIEILGLALLTVVILFAHRKNLYEIGKLYKVKPPGGGPAANGDSHEKAFGVNL
jgi:glycerol-3-phosphate acyltransferase PlsY